MKPNIWPFVLMVLGVLLLGAGVVWQMTIQRNKPQAFSASQSHTSDSTYLARDAATKLEPRMPDGTDQTPRYSEPSISFTSDDITLYGPVDADGRHRTLCTPEGICLPLKAVADYIRREGKPR